MNHRIWITLACLSAAHRLLAAEPQSVRLALLTEGTAAVTAADLLTAEFSKQERVILLERAEIDRVYREQRLSSVDNNFGKLGQVLGAEGLLLLGTVMEDTNTFLVSRLVAVKPAVVIRSVRTPWPLTNASSWAQGMVKHLAPVLPKLAVLEKDAIPISIVNLRSTLRSVAAREMEEQLTLLLNERLSREPRLFALERRRMELLSTEKDLRDMGESPFWSGSYLLDGTIDRDGYSEQEVTINARLVPPKGGATVSIDLSGSRTSLGDLVNRLAAEVTRKLSISSGAMWNPAEEAEQYLEEARWAYRWGLLPEAQAASESAWALGKRNREIAMLRIRSYANAVLSRPLDVCLGAFLPPVPEAGKLKLASRACELYCQNSDLIWTNPAAVDVESYDLGLQVLATAGALLAHFNQMAELLHGNEEPLSNLRSESRRIFELLRTKIPAHDPRDCRNLTGMQWSSSGFWFDRPEDAMAIYRELVDKKLHPADLPPIVAWSWEDRKRIPGLLKQFVEDLRHSTNADIRLDGFYLAMVLAPDDPEGTLSARENDFYREFWEQRQRILSLQPVPQQFVNGREESSLLARAEGILRKKHEVHVVRFTHEPFADFKSRLRTDFLLNSVAYYEGGFQVLFRDNPLAYDGTEARELIPKLQEIKRRLKLDPKQAGSINETIQMLSGRLTNSVSAADAILPIVDSPPRNVPPNRASGPDRHEVIKFDDWRSSLPGIDDDFVVRFQSMIVRRGKLWVQLQYRRRPGDFSKGRAGFISLDQQTATIEGTLFPQELSLPDRSFEVTADALIVSVQDQLQKYQFQEKRWLAIPLPLEKGCIIAEQDGRLYLSSAESLLELNGDAQTVQVLASTRRRPSINPLDSIGGFGIVTRGQGGKLNVTVAGGRQFSFKPGSQIYEEVKDSSSPLNLRGPVREESQDTESGTLRRVLDQAGRSYVRVVWKGNSEEELLLAQRSRVEPASPAVNLGRTKWNWPDEYTLQTAFLAPEGKRLWALARRQQTPASASPAVDQVQTSLLCFDPDLPDALCVPLDFDRDGQLTDPFDPSGGQIKGVARKDRWLDTRRGLLVIAPELGGSWMISKTALEPRLDIIRKSLRNGAKPEVAPKSGKPATPKP